MCIKYFVAICIVTSDVRLLCGVEQRAPPTFGRATIRLGVGPHSICRYFIVCSQRLRFVTRFNKTMIDWLIDYKYTLFSVYFKTMCFGPFVIRFVEIWGACNWRVQLFWVEFYIHYCELLSDFCRVKMIIYLLDLLYRSREICAVRNVASFLPQYAAVLRGAAQQHLVWTLLWQHITM